MAKETYMNRRKNTCNLVLDVPIKRVEKPVVMEEKYWHHGQHSKPVNVVKSWGLTCRTRSSIQGVPILHRSLCSYSVSRKWGRFVQNVFCIFHYDLYLSLLLLCNFRTNVHKKANFDPFFAWESNHYRLPLNILYSDCLFGNLTGRVGETKGKTGFRKGFTP